MAKKRSPGPKIDAAPHDLHCPVGNRSSYLRSDALTLHFGCRTFGRADAKEPCTNNLTIEPLWPRRGRPALRGCDDQVIFARLLKTALTMRLRSEVFRVEHPHSTWNWRERSVCNTCRIVEKKHYRPIRGGSCLLFRRFVPS